MSARRWTGSNDGPHPGDVAVLVVCVLGFLVLFFTGALK